MITMKQTIFLAILAGVLPGFAQEVFDEVEYIGVEELPTVSNAVSFNDHGAIGLDSVSVTRDGNNLTIDALLDLSDINVRSNEALVITPQIATDADTLRLSSIGLYGRTRYLQYQRRGSMVTGNDELSILASKCDSTFIYSKTLAYQDWMDGANVILLCDTYGCCSRKKSSTEIPLGHYSEPVPEPEPERVIDYEALQFIVPAAEGTKQRTANATAFIDFVVNRTEINPEYRNNRGELDRITSLIDSIRDDGDYTLQHIIVKGYASPEGSYANNDRLAKERTMSFRDYITTRYDFDPKMVLSEWMAENWPGLRTFVQNWDNSAAPAILNIIDSDLTPDKKEAKIKRDYPKAYAWLLQNVYPGLRRTDCSINYDVHTFTNIPDIERVIKTKPQDLSLNELYLLANSYEPGSEDFVEVFITAARLFPDDPVSNLNAANASLLRGDTVSAAKYLSKAPAGPEKEAAERVLSQLSQEE